MLGTYNPRSSDIQTGRKNGNAYVCVYIYIYVCVCTHTLCIYTHPYTKEFGKQELEEDIATGRERESERASESFRKKQKERTRECQRETERDRTCAQIKYREAEAKSQAGGRDVQTESVRGREREGDTDKKETKTDRLKY